jgi:DNA-binding beta-propeller fold protein YncE
VRKSSSRWGFGPSLACGVTAALAPFVVACGNGDAAHSAGGSGGLAGQIVPSTGGVVVASGGAGSASAAGSGGALVPPPVFLDGKVQKAAYAAPVAGGTLSVTRDDVAIVADPDRDRVFLVDLGTHAVRDIAVEPKDELGRVAVGPPGVAYVVARRGGALIALDLAAGTVQRRVPVCAAPRGVAYDAATQSVHVACRSGLLITLDAASLAPRRRLSLDPDLRDVVVHGSELVVTRFKSAELLVLDATGALVRRGTPAPDSNCSSASVLYRAAPSPDGHVYLAHGTASNRSVNTSPGGYGSSCAGGISVPFVSNAEVDAVIPADAGGERTISVQSTRVANGSGPLDIAVSPDGSRVALVVTGNSWNATALVTTSLTQNPRPVLLVADPTASGPVLGSVFGVSFPLRGEPTAVAFDSRGKYLAQSREPATLELEDGTLIPLSSQSHADTGLALFHVNTGLGIACASCHPEGDEDGHTWRFNVGYRRTQPLGGGVTKRAPFHWVGDLPALPELIDEVMRKRMGLLNPLEPGQIEALGSWLDSIPAAATADDLDAAAVQRGRTVFEAGGAAACASCHSGPQLSDGKTHDVGTGGNFITPTLLGAGSRTPLMHDGCAKTLAERFGRCGGGAMHGDPARFSASEQADLSEYLRSL